MEPRHGFADDLMKAVIHRYVPITTAALIAEADGTDALHTASLNRPIHGYAVAALGADERLD
jgi:hypothetical protein